VYGAAVDPRDTYGMPSDRSSLQEMGRALSVLMRRENRSDLCGRLAARAQLKLDPAVCCCCCTWPRTQTPRRSPANLSSLFCGGRQSARLGQGS
jgi:hypothetical protein